MVNVPIFALAAFFLHPAISAPVPAEDMFCFGPGLCPPPGMIIKKDVDAPAKTLPGHIQPTFKPAINPSKIMPAFTVAPNANDKLARADDTVCPLYISHGRPCTEPAFAHCPCATPIPALPVARAEVIVTVPAVAAVTLPGHIEPSFTSTAGGIPLPDHLKPTLSSFASPSTPVTVAKAAEAPAATAGPVRGVPGGSSWLVANPGGPLSLVAVE